MKLVEKRLFFFALSNLVGTICQAQLMEDPWPRYSVGCSVYRRWDKVNSWKVRRFAQLCPALCKGKAVGLAFSCGLSWHAAPARQEETVRHRERGGMSMLLVWTSVCLRCRKPLLQVWQRSTEAGRAQLSRRSPAALGCS